MCEQRVAQGELPQCVINCGGHARWFGDLDQGIESFVSYDEPSPNVFVGLSYDEMCATRATLGEFCEEFDESQVHALPNVGNNPAFRYILRKSACREGSDMELQWPLILFTTLVAWSAGLFGTQALLAAGGHAKKSQTPAWVASAVLLAAGGIAVFFHLEHWERIFNGFGHLTSGITQELIAVVVLAVVAVAYLIVMRRSDDGATVPKWLCWASVAVCAVLVAVMAHSYTMAARPAWDSVLWILYVLGNACALGPCTMALIMAAAGDETAPAGLPALAGAALGAAAAVAFAASLQASAGAFAEVGFYFDPTHPTAGMADAAAAVAAQAPLLWAGAVLVGGALPLAAAFMGRKTANWRLWGTVAVACALAGAVALRVVFYELGLSVFMFY